MNTGHGKPDDDRLLKMHEIAAEMHAAPKTVHRRIQSGKLKAAFKEGGRWMIWRSQLLAYLNAGGGSHV